MCKTVVEQVLDDFSSFLVSFFVFIVNSFRKNFKLAFFWPSHITPSPFTSAPLASSHRASVPLTSTHLTSAHLHLLILHLLVLHLLISHLASLSLLTSFYSLHLLSLRRFDYI